MDRRIATLILIAFLAPVGLVGAALLRDAWSGRHNKAASVATPAARARPAVSPTLAEASAVYAGI